jgi:hypothetical protein
MWLSRVLLVCQAKGSKNSNLTKKKKKMLAFQQTNHSFKYGTMGGMGI